MSIVAFELVDNEERVFIQWDDGRWTEQKVYHVGDEGILCRDLETYIEFKDFEECA